MKTSYLPTESVAINNLLGEYYEIILSINFKAYDYNQMKSTLGGNMKIGSQNVLSKYNFYILKSQVYY